MKLSSYILEYSENNNHLLTNIFSGADLLLTSEQYSEYKKIIKILPQETESELFQTLCKNFFVIPDYFDERAILELKRKSATFNLTPSDQKYVIAPTLDCNARCPYCYEKDLAHKKYMSADAQAKLADYIIRSIKGKKTLNLSWFGGEPLLNPSAIEGISKKVIEYCNQNSIIYYANMTTNGLLTDKYISLLESCKIDSIQITLDGTKEIYNRTKDYIDCEDAFEKVLNNIYLLASHDIFVSIRMNVSKTNIDDLKDLCCLLINDSRWNKNISIYFSPLLDYENTVSDYFDESEYYSMFEELYQTLFDLGYYSSPKQFQIKPKSISCYGHDLVTVAIGPDGEFYNCQHELGTPEKVIGDIYTGMHFSKSIVAEHSKPLANKCSKCKFLPVCQGGCFFADQIANCPLKCQSVKYEYKVRSKLLYNFITKSK